MKKLELNQMEMIEGGSFFKCAVGTLSTEAMGGLTTGLCMIALGASGPIGWMIGCGLGAMMGAASSC